MAAPRVFDANRVPIVLGKGLGRGGEGAVYEIQGRPDSVAKLYLRQPTPAHQAKLIAMTGMASPTLLRLAAWPTSTMQDASGAVVGFVMPKVMGHNPVFKLYGPKLRLQEFPRADWRFLIHAAANTARAFSTIHTAGLVIGDVNHGNLVVGRDATVRLIDCDSFQVSKGKHTWFCEVGVDTHQPPEMQAKASYAGVFRTPNHDNFGLAVLIFQLLCMGRHPFAGRFLGTGDPPTIPEAIAKSRYAYSRDRQRTMLAPSAGSLPMDALASDVQDLFEAAFGPSAIRGGRPTGEQWVTALDKLASNLRECRQNQAHHFLSRLPHCPWCQIEAASGAPLFPVVFVTAPGATMGIVALWQEVTRLREPRPLPGLPDLNDQKIRPSIRALTLAKSARRWQVGAYAALATSTTLAFAVAAPDMRLLVAATIGASAAGIVGLGRTVPASRERRDLEKARKDWQALKPAWNAPAGMPHFADVRRELDLKKGQHDDLPNERAKRLQRLSEHIKQRQLEEYLDRFPIATARIRGIGPAKVAMLASYGINTAGDIELYKVLAVPGFGEVTTRKVLAWRQWHERTFRFDPHRGISPSDSALVERDIALTRAAIERDLSAGLARLKAIAASADARRSALEGQAAEIMDRYAQAAADVRAIPGDPVTHKRLLGLAGATLVLAMIMLALGRSPQAELPAAGVANVAAPPSASFPSNPATDQAPRRGVSNLSVTVAPKPTPVPVPPTDIQGPTPPERAPTALSSEVWVVARQAANVRESPNNGSAVLRIVPKGAALRVYDRRDGWIQVGDAIAWGWVYSGLLAPAQ